MMPMMMRKTKDGLLSRALVSDRTRGCKGAREACTCVQTSVSLSCMLIPLPLRSCQAYIPDSTTLFDTDPFLLLLVDWRGIWEWDDDGGAQSAL